MKKLLNFALIAGMLMIGTLASQAATYTKSLTATDTNTSAFTNVSVRVSQIIISNGDAASGHFSFIDAPDTNSTYTRATFDSVVSYPTNFITVYTNFTGVVSTNTNSAIFTTTLTVAAATNNYASKLSVDVASGSTYTYTPAAGEYFSYGLLITNSAVTNSSITIKYVPR